MPVERFSKETFESALPVHKETGEPLWNAAGLVKGEYVYHVPVTGTNKRIVIRSSIRPNGLSAKTGQDSIRLYLQYYYRKADEWRPLKKLDRWTTRVPGWQLRMTNKLRELWQFALDDSNGHTHASGANESNQIKTSNEGQTQDSLVPLGGEGTTSKTDTTSIETETGIGSQAPDTSDPVPSPSNTIDPVLPLGRETSDQIEDNVVSDAGGQRSQPEPNDDQKTAITAPVDAAVRVLAGPGSGKCVAKGTLVLTDHGLLPIEQTRLDMHVLNHEQRTVSPSHLHDLGKQNTIIIKTNAGYEIEGTPEHPVLCLHQDKIIWRTLSDLQLNDAVLLAWNTEQFGTYETEWKTEGAYVMGQLTADGNVANAHNGYVALHKMGKMANPFCEMMEKLGYNVHHVSQKHCNSETHSVSSVGLAGDLQFYGFPKGVAKDKEVPWSILTGSRENQVAYLQGYFDLESYCGYNCIEVVTASEKLSKQLQTMLINFGIRVSRQPKIVPGYGLYWRMHISGDALRMYSEKIGYRLAEKKANNLVKVASKKSNTNVDKFPLSPTYFRGIREKLKETTTWDGKRQRAILPDGSIMYMSHYLKGNREMSRRKLSTIAALTGDHLATELASHWLVDKVSEVNKGCSRVLDYTVPDGHSFISNGFVSHNTFCTEERVAFLLENGAKPEDILAVTFSKPMADSSLNRIIARNPELEGTAAEKQICTIHAICYRMLKDAGDSRSVAKDWQIKKALGEIAERLWPYAEDRPGWKEVYQWIGQAKYKGLTTAEDLSFYIDNLGDYHGRNVHEARRQFDEQIRGQRLLTFPDMLFDVEQKLKREMPFRIKWQQRFKWVLVDECQDTSGQAMRILTTLAQPQNQVFMVGDGDQLLYRFAGATPEANLYEGFDNRYPDGITVKLKTNYRSTKAVVDTQLTLIRKNYVGEGGPYDQRFLKDLEPRPSAPEGQPVTFREYEDVFEEADALVEAIREQLANGHEPGHIFVCARTRAQLGYAEGPLVRAKVPFINICGGSFWNSKHVADVIAYLRLAFDNGNDAAFKRVYNVASNWNVHPWGDQKGEYCHHRYLGRAFLDACSGSYTNIWQAVGRRHSFEPGVEDLTQFVQELENGLACATSPAQALRQIVEDCYKRYLAADEGITVSDDAENGKLEDLETVIEVAEQFETVEGFLEYVDEAVQAAEAAKDKSWDNYVVLSSCHKLKGLEREIVFVLGCSENGERGLLPHTFSLSEPPQMGVLPTGGKGRVEDERCIMFVAVSRAKEECYLSGIRRYRKDVLRPSRFVYEMGLIDETESELLNSALDLDTLTMDMVRRLVNDNPDHPVAVAWAEMLIDDCYEVGEYAEAAEEAQFEAGLEMDEFMESLEAG